MRTSAKLSKLKECQYSYILKVIVVVEQLRRELHLALDCVLAK